MNTLFLGLAMSPLYGILSCLLIYLLDGEMEFERFLTFYSTSFKTLIAFGLILGTSLIVFRSQNVIPLTIEDAFSREHLQRTDYYFYKWRFISRERSVKFSAYFIVAGFVIFSLCQFPLKPLGDALMMIPACAQYALGVYVGRKLFYAGMMLHSLLEVTVDKNLFKDRSLDEINVYVHVVSTLMIIFGYVHLTGYAEGPFLFNSQLGESVKVLLMIPAFIGTPVLLIFNFYPRHVLRKLYDKSIDVEIGHVQQMLQDESITSFEKKSYLMEFDRMSREELRYSLQLTLSDLPIGITILVMVLEALISK